MTSSPRRFSRWVCAAALTVSALLPAFAGAQQPVSRIAGAVAGATRSTLVGSHADYARTTTDVGRLSGTTPLNGMSLEFARSAAQEADLQTLLAAQQNPASPLFHAWLTPEQFGARFGMSDADLSAAQAWLEQQGFKVDAVARSRNRITFSGTTAQAETAFGTEIHRYQGKDGQTHFAPSTDLSLPGPLAAVTHTVMGLSSFKPRPHLRYAANMGAHYTSSLSGAVHFTPADIRTVYDINPAYNSGFTGAGQTIAVVGESAVYVTDIEHFQSASGLAVKDPTITLVPNTGSSQVYSEDESESDLDLEYSGSIAPGATINFVYAGSNANATVTTAIAYAVDNKIGTIISTSYGECEANLMAGAYASQNAVLAQAAAQGQTVVSASGDAGSSDCAETNSRTGAITDTGLAVDFPASSQYVTSMGGTENPAADDVAGNMYWQAQNTSSDIISSAMSYIPEVVWNDTTASLADGGGFSAGGGGASTLTGRPTWQVGVPGISAGTTRLVPDLALAASPYNPGYLYCSSDPTTEISGSCTYGFRDSGNEYLTIVGGTSVATPIFAGMVALINQATGATTGQGVVNTTLYALAANSTTYASAFHDITSGNNTGCPTVSSYCTETSATTFAAGVGYDEASGLGSVDLYNLLRAWNTTGTTTSGLLASTTTIAAATTTPASGASDMLTITVAPGSGTGSTVTPTGTVSLVVDGVASSTLSLTSGTANYTFSSATSGTHTVAVTYSGDTVYAASAATVTLTVPTTTNANSSFTIAATNVTVTAGSSGTSTVTVTPANGYNGTVDWAITSSATLNNACYAIANTVVNGSAAVSTTLTVYTSAQACTTETPLTVKGGRHAFLTAGGNAQARASRPGVPAAGGQGGATRWAMAAFGLFGLLGLRARRLRPLALVLLLTGAGVFVTGCGSGGSSTSAVTTNAATGTYTLSLKGTDSGSASFNASTTFTLTVQ